MGKTKRKRERKKIEKKAIEPKETEKKRSRKKRWNAVRPYQKKLWLGIKQIQAHPYIQHTSFFRKLKEEKKGDTGKNNRIKGKKNPKRNRKERKGRKEKKNTIPHAFSLFSFTFLSFFAPFSSLVLFSFLFWCFVLSFLLPLFPFL